MLVQTSINNGSMPLNRKTELEAPTMLLTGHQGAIYSVRFHPEGKIAASAGHDRNIFVWEIGRNCRNMVMLKGHKNAVLQLSWSPRGENLFSCAADHTAAVWDTNTFEKVKKVNAHSDVVNSLWDIRTRDPVVTYTHELPVTAVALCDANSITGSIDGQIRFWERRKPSVARELAGHTDLISSLQVSADEKLLLSSSFDNTCRVWDICPYSSAEGRFLRGVSLPVAGMESQLVRSNWAQRGERFATGSSDGSAYVFETVTGKTLYRLPGHAGTATEVDYSSSDPIVISGGVDGKIYVGEI